MLILCWKRPTFKQGCNRHFDSNTGRVKISSLVFKHTLPKVRFALKVTRTTIQLFARSISTFAWQINSKESLLIVMRHQSCLNYKLYGCNKPRAPHRPSLKLVRRTMFVLSLVHYLTWAACESLTVRRAFGKYLIFYWTNQAKSTATKDLTLRL